VFCTHRARWPLARLAIERRSIKRRRSKNYLEGDAPGDEVVGEDGEGGALERRRLLVHRHVGAAHYVVDAGVRVCVEADVRRRRAVPLQQDVAFLLRDAHLLPAMHPCKYRQNCINTLLDASSSLHHHQQAVE